MREKIKVRSEISKTAVYTFKCVTVWGVFVGSKCFSSWSDTSSS